MRASEHERMYRLEAEHFWFVGTRQVIVDVLTRALGAELAGARVLDLGCGTGYTLTQLPSAVRPVGLDRSPHALALSTGRGTRASFVRADAGALPFANNGFDAVLALDVLEHLTDDSGATRELARVLRPGGVAIITVPAFRSLWSRHDEALDHQRRYRLRELISTVRAAGLELDFASYYNTWLLPLVALARWSERLLPARARREESTLALPPAPLNRLLATVLASERYVLRHTALPVGVSCLLIARKPRMS